jgi:hypothetical protein
MFINETSDCQEKCRIEEAQPMISQARDISVNNYGSEILDVYIYGIQKEKPLYPYIFESVNVIEYSRQICQQSKEYIIEVLRISEEYI